jgi:aryl-alcohol dehydrogenase-like predicted oxidoreductase
MDAAVGQIGRIDRPEARRMVDRCREAGINYIDTADVYSAGDSERILGDAVGVNRRHFIIGSKVTMRTGPGQNDVGSSRSHIVSACEASLGRLKTDWIDLYQLHYPDGLTPIEETLRALEDLVRAGKIRYVGCSNFAGWQVVAGVAAAAATGGERFVSHQISYSLTERDAEIELVPASLAHGLGIMIWGPLAGGFLSGKYRRGCDKPKGTRLDALPNYPSVRDWEKGFDIVEVVCAIAEQRGVSAAEVALNWALRRPWITSVILGARSEAQLDSNLKTLAWTLSAEEMQTLDAASEPYVPYPVSVQRLINGDRTPSLPRYRG